MEERKLKVEGKWKQKKTIGNKKTRRSQKNIGRMKSKMNIWADY